MHEILPIGNSPAYSYGCRALLVENATNVYEGKKLIKNLITKNGFTLTKEDEVNVRGNTIESSS